MLRNKLIATFAVIMLLSGCSNSPKENTINSSGSAVVVNESNLKLPKNISLESVNSAFTAYRNFRLWNYPEESKASQINFTPYIGKEITAEVRMFESNPESVFIHTELGNSLGKVVNKDGFVYLGGFVQLDETSSYPQGNYEKVYDIKINVKTPHKPNYGTSPIKEKIDSCCREIRCKCLQGFHNRI